MAGTATARKAKPDGGSDLEKLKAGMDVLDRLRSEFEASLNVRGETIAALEEEVAEKDGEIADLKNEVSDLNSELCASEDRAAELEEFITTLARVRTKIRGGAVADGLYDLETVLSHLDSAWRTRA